MKPQRNPRYLASIRTQPCCVCGCTRGIEASHTGPHGLGQKSPDSSAIPLCAKHHRTGTDSYHRLGTRKLSEKHNLNIPAIVRTLRLKPIIRVEAEFFVAYLETIRDMCCAKPILAFILPYAKLCNSAGRAKRPMRLPPDGNRFPMKFRLVWVGSGDDRQRAPRPPEDTTALADVAPRSV
jgi:hypothetical protein